MYSDYKELFEQADKSQRVPNSHLGMEHIASCYREMGASNERVNPAWVARLAHILHPNEREVAEGKRADEVDVLLERCTEIKVFNSVLVTKAPESLGPEFLDATTSSLIFPSAPLMAVSKTTGELKLVLGFAYDRGIAWIFQLNQKGYEGFDSFYRAMMRQKAQVHLAVGPATSQKSRDFIRWLVGTPLTKKDFRPVTAGGRYHARRGGYIPKPFYVVQPKDYVSRTPAEARAHGGLDFRFERRGHLRLLVERSMEPLEPRDGWQLLGPQEEPGPRLAAHLEARGHAPKQLGEYLMVRIAVVTTHIVGPEDKPFVPSVKEVKHG